MIDTLDAATIYVWKRESFPHSRSGLGRQMTRSGAQRMLYNDVDGRRRNCKVCSA